MKGKNLIGIVLVVVVCLAAMLWLFLGNTNESSDGKDVQEQIALANRYLEELDYERAIATYESVIEIDERSVEAYTGLAEAYMQKGDVDKAIEVLEQGIAATDNEDLIVQLNEIRNTEEDSSKGAEDTPEATEAPEVTEEPEEPETKARQERVESGMGEYYIHHYDENNHLVKNETYDANDVLQYIWYYDENGNWVKAEYYENNQLREYIEYTYDENGNQISALYYDTEGLYCGNEFIYEENRIIRKVYSYRQYGRVTVGGRMDKPIVRTEFYNVNGFLDRSEEFFYDENGNWTGSISYNGDGSINHYEEPIINNAGEIIGSRSYQPDGTVIREDMY